MTFVPGLQPIGIAANAINAYLYFEEGNTFQGICSALSALPGLGTAIGNIGKAGSKLSTATGIISKFLHTTSNVGFIATGSYTIGSMLKYNYDHYIEGNENYTWKNALNDFVNGTFAVLSIYGGAKGLGWDKIEVPTTVKGSVDFGIFGSKKGSGLVDPNEIRFSQSSVNGSGELIESMTANGWKGEPIDIVRMPDGIYTTIDNTRVVAARQVGIKVQANVHSFDDILPLEYVERFTTKNGVPVTWGDAVEFRIKNQNSQFRNNYPYGSYEMFKIN